MRRSGVVLQHVNRHNETRATKLTLVSVFVGLLGTLAARLVPSDRELTPRRYDLLLLGLASFRSAFLISTSGHSGR